MSLTIPVREMDPTIMQMLEDRGAIIRLCPSHHRFEVEPGCGEGRDIYVSDPACGSHKLLSVVINRTEFSAFGYHEDNEEFLLIGGKDEKTMVLLIGLYTAEELEQKAKKHRLSENDFICLRCKFNDPEVSFFTMRKNIPHGEACMDEQGHPASFFVTESSGIHLFPVDLPGYSLSVRM